MKDNTNDPSFTALINDVTPIAKVDKGKVRTLKGNQTTPQSQAARRNAATQNLVQQNHLNNIENTQVAPEEPLFFANESLDKASMRRLRQGQIRPTVWLDLHGNTVAQAQTRVKQTLQDALTQQHRCLLIIHGKGGHKIDPFVSKNQLILSAETMPAVAAKAILKNHVNQWLQQHPQVLGFCSAKPKDGGTGAVYVLLRSRA